MEDSYPDDLEIPDELFIIEDYSERDFEEHPQAKSEIEHKIMLSTCVSTKGGPLNIGKQYSTEADHQLTTL